MAPHFASWNRRALHYLGLLARIVAGVALLYLLVLNVLVATPLLRSLVSKHLGRDLHIEYRRAYSLIPGRIHVDGLSLRGSDSHVEWLLTIDTATFDWHPFAIRTKTFFASRVLASGLEFRARLLESVPDPAHDANVPSIAGFANPPLKPIGPQTTVTDATYDLASVHLEGVDAEHARLIWVDTLRVAGDAHLKGRWEFRPLRRMAIGPAELEASGLDVGIGTAPPFVNGIQGTLDGEIEPYDVRVPVDEMLRHISAHAKIKSSIDTDELGEIVHYPAAIDPPTGRGTLALDAGLRHGVLSEGTSASLVVQELALGAFGVPATLSLEARGHVSPSSGHSEATVELLLRDVSLGQDTRADTIAGTLTSGTVDLSRPFDDLRYRLEVPELWAPRLDQWNRFLPRGVTTAGAARIGGEISGALHGSTKTAVTVHATRLMLTRVSTGSIETDADLALAATLDDKRAEGSVELTVENVRASTKTLDVTGLASLRASAWSIGWSEAGTQASTGPVHVRLTDLDARSREGTHARLGHIGELLLSSKGTTLEKGVPDGNVAFELKDGLVPDIAQTFALLHASGLDIRRGTATAAAKGEVDLKTRSVGGGVDVRVRGLELHAAGTTVKGDVRLSVSARRAGSESLTYVGGTSLALDHVDGAGGSDWWGRAQITAGAVEWAEDGLHGRLFLGVEMRDAKPLDTFASSASGIPRWILGVFSLPDLRARGELLFAPHLVALHEIRASGGITSVEAEIEKNSAGSNGVVLAQHGALEVGVGLGTEKPRVMLFGAGSWFRDRKLELTRRLLGWAGPEEPGRQTP